MEHKNHLKLKYLYKYNLKEQQNSGNVKYVTVIDIDATMRNPIEKKQKTYKTFRTLNRLTF